MYNALIGNIQLFNWNFSGIVKYEIIMYAYLDKNIFYYDRYELTKIL